MQLTVDQCPNYCVKKNIQHDKPFTELPQSADELGSACSSVIPTTKLKIFYTILSTIPHIVQDITHACKRYLFLSFSLTAIRLSLKQARRVNNG